MLAATRFFVCVFFWGGEGELGWWGSWGSGGASLCFNRVCKLTTHPGPVSPHLNERTTAERFARCLLAAANLIASLAARNDHDLDETTEDGRATVS